MFKNAILLQLPTEKIDSIEKTISNLKSINLSELSIQSQKLLALPVEEQQVFSMNENFLPISMIHIISLFPTGFHCQIC